MEEAVGEGTLNEVLDALSNEELVAELAKRHLSIEGTRFEITQRLAKARYAELGFNWPDPQASDLAAGGVNPDGKQPDPFQPISSQVLGAVLIQHDEDGIELPIAYASRCLHGPEVNYTVSELECLSIIWAIEKFRGYLEGRHFTVVTDHSCLLWLRSIKNPTGRLARWAMKLLAHDITIVHKKGFAAKLAPRYKGPFAVSKVTSPLVYEVIDDSGRVKVAYVNDLKPYRGRTDPAVD